MGVRRAFPILLPPIAGVLLAASCSSGSGAPSAAVSDGGVEATVVDAGIDHVTHPRADASGDWPTGPALLSQTGLYSDFAARKLAPDLVAFTPRYEFWSDGVQKTRYLYLPPGTKIDTSRMDHWVFPVGTKAFKEFRVGGKLVETRLLMKVTKDFERNLAWFEAPYVWRADGTDADRVLDGLPDALGTGHRIPEQADCRNCHGDVVDVLLGVSAIQLSDPIKNPLGALQAAGRLTNPPPTGIEIPGTGNVKDTLAYLHANCGHCHNDEAVKLATQTRMRLRLLLSQKTPEETGAFTTTVGYKMVHVSPEITDVVVKGVPEKSGLYARMGLRGGSESGAMPPSGTDLVDPTGRELVRQWIADWK